MASLLGEIAGRLLRPPFWLLRLTARLPVFRLRDVVFFVETSAPVVALTLDDGPHESVTRSVLNVLDAHDAKATFFLIGEKAERQPDVVELVASRGHELGNHGWSHEGGAELSASTLSDGIARTQRVLERFGRVRLFRPGGGSLLGGAAVTIAEQHGCRCVLGSVYPHDVRIGSTDFIVNDVLKRVRKGAIIVLHEGAPERGRVTEVLQRVLGEIARRGYVVTTVSDLLELEPRR
jgi:peptidoglycan-N-acetylglucosamine deacetylase